MIKFAELVCYSFAQRGERIMIEVIYEKEKEKAEGNQAFFRIPNNIRQIGEIQGNQKIYIEDYAYTYLCRIASEDSAKGRAAILLGQANWKDGKTYLFIKSAVALHDIEVSEEHFAFTKDVWKQIYEENKKFFPNQEIVGWFLSLPGCSMELHEGICKTHFNHFGGNEKVLMVMEPLEKEEAFYRYEEGKLTRQEGFYVYYEKNEPMQNFLIEQNKYAKERSEKVADEAVKTFRKKVEEKTKGKKRDKIAPLFRMASASAAAAMLIAGVLYLNQYEKLKKTNSIADKAKIEKKKSETVVSNSDNDTENIEKSEASDTENLKEETQTGTESDSISGSMDGKRDKKSEQANAGAEGNKQGESARQEQQAETGSDRTGSENTAQSTGNTSMAQTTGSNSPHETYTVREGDTITSISRAYYGTTSKIKEICELNGISAEEFIFPGQKILLP